jgi:hypothetical protein
VISVPMPESGFGALVGVEKTLLALKRQMRWNSAAAIAAAAGAACQAVFLWRGP